MIKGVDSTKQITKLIKKVRKRDGEVAPFDIKRITSAIEKAMQATGEGSSFEAYRVAEKVVLDLYKSNIKNTYYTPSVEEIQDAVERALIFEDYADTAKAYILYRQKHSELRTKGKKIPQDVVKLVKESQKYFKNPLAEFVYYTSYARWRDDLGRRETWVETVDRYMDFMKENLGKKLTAKEYDEVRDAILSQEVCPSMRLLWSAGPAARRTNVCAYNCSFIAPTKLRDFGEIMYISMCGTGVGYSVEPEFTEQLPQIQRQKGKMRKTHVIEDSKEGWADAFVHGLETWFAGENVEFDFSKIRPAGSRLTTMGGRASGPEPLMDLIRFAREKVFSRQGKRLRTIDVHDIVCKIGEIVVAGGVRRSAMISLSDLDDHLVRDAKKGEFYIKEPQRSMANNSAVYKEKPTAELFLEEWNALIQSKSGERGIFNAVGLSKQLPKRRVEFLSKKYGDDSGHWPVRTNPCGEIYLQSKQFCNLSSIVVRANDTMEDMERKMEVATLLGTYQSSLTNFGYLSKEWKKNSDDERLLGVSITGYYDNKKVRDDAALKRLREVGDRANKKYAKRFGINQSMAITCVKPHGNSSQLLDTASGMHPRYAKYYIRRVRVSATDPIFRMLKDQGVPYFPEVGQSEESAYTFVLEFPVAAPRGSVVNDDISALDLLSEWKRLKQHFTQHNPSTTVYVGENEWLQVANFVYENWDFVGGLSFLPRSDHVYKLAPYEAIDKKEYERRAAQLASIDFSQLVAYEQDDQTKGAKELACVAGTCEI